MATLAMRHTSRRSVDVAAIDIMAHASAARRARASVAWQAMEGFVDDNMNTVAEARTLDSRDRKVGHWNAWAKESGFEPFAEWVEGDGGAARGVAAVTAEV
jgi:hypothetical protein